MRSARPLAALLTLAALAGCAAPVVYRDPSTGQAINCTALAMGQAPDVEAARLAAFPAPSATTGTDVPRPGPITEDVRGFDQERQCEAQLKRAGWTCTSGCR